MKNHLWLPLLLIVSGCGSGGGGGFFRRDGGGDGFQEMDSGTPDLFMSSCNDNMKNGSETDIDCGGACPPCADGRMCLKGGDCVDQVCINQQCAMPNCNDGFKNGNESDTDCGGSCSACPNGRKCNGSGDCQSLFCMNGTCATPPCQDGVQDGNETDVDCGGGSCPSCTDGLACLNNADCQSFQCSNNLCCSAGTLNCDGNKFNGCEVVPDSDPFNCGTCGHACPNNQNCVAGQCVANACVGKVGGAILAVMPNKLNGYCWYLSQQGSTCDQVCAAAAGATNQANAAFNTLVDDCNGGGVGQPATWFYQNGNACGWTGPTGAATGYKTLGHGYNASTYYGHCNGANATGTGTFPGTTSDNNTRCIVCACSK